MYPFRDATGREWTVKVDVGALKRVRARCDVDLLDAVKGDLLDRIRADPCLLCDVLHAVAAPGEDPEVFGAAMNGQALEDGAAALLRGLADFFPSRRGEVLHAAIRKIEQASAAVEARAVAQATADLDALDVEALIETSISGRSSTSARESSG